ncbi:MAG: XRE family transcriptional regulator [Methylotenera sp.]|nr:XRE family transcriptional regulator [Methylotenera sp.]MDO9234207.1 XRE family transcriptional regulator [Methylotenera sp.]MDP2403128.1 XRE family transcriptional regulator [Methylotenera sp.]MDP3096171.1 XRE family transcriptional regulator [Methylotenera sp.]MDZ4223086.1 XRE family transcriptional regulator [Methylotenera sp.]
MEMQLTIRKRLLRLREARKVSQEDLSKEMGMNNRQSLAEFESGNRAIQPQELLAAAKFFGVAHSYFTDPLELAGEASFSWRKSSQCDASAINAFEQIAGKWIATYRHLGKLMNATVNSSLTQIDIRKDSTFEEAYLEGSNVANALELGDVPAHKLLNVLNEKLDILILHSDAVPGISGAACKLGPLNTIMINRNEVPARRNFDLAHEFFHLLTWDRMQPEHIEDSDPSKKPKVEQLADAFASGLLMPESSILKYIQVKGMPNRDNPIWIKEAATHFKVSGQAMKWRLKSLGYFSHTDASKIDDSALKIELHDEKPNLLSDAFVQRLGWAIENGEMSVRKVADTLQMTIDDLELLFSSYQLIAPFDL